MFRFQRSVGQRLAPVGFIVLGLAPVGCGAVQEDYTLVAPSEARAAASPDEKNQLKAADRQQARACLLKHGQPWKQRGFELQYDAEVNEKGEITSVKLRGTTLPEDVESCLQQLIGGLTVPEQTMRSRSSGPVSGGERMRREERGPLGTRQLQNPIVWAFVILLETVEIEVVVQVFIGVVAAVGTIATSKKDPTGECLDKYVACQDTPLGDLQVDKHGHSVCQTCYEKCRNEGTWPLGFEKAVGWQTCL